MAKIDYEHPLPSLQKYNRRQRGAPVPLLRRIPPSTDRQLRNTALRQIVQISSASADSVPSGRRLNPPFYMMLELFHDRSSTRSFLPDKIDKKLLLDCLQAARMAPSACNSQPWHFIVIDEEPLKNKVAQHAFSGIHTMNAFAQTAPVLIVVISEKSSLVAQIGSKIKGVHYRLLDIGAAIENLLLQAQIHNLKTCWLGWFDELAVKKILKIPRDRKIESLIALGYSHESAREKNRKDLNEIASFNGYKR